MNKFITLCIVLILLNVHVCKANTESCDTSPGLFDSNVLALSSQPGFCQTYGYEAGKPECTHLSKNSYQARHLTLHGLWPNQNACGNHYGFCNVPQQNHHCDYPPLALSNEVSENLKKLMPGYKYGSCLERHEWNKHGSCQILSVDNYFALSMQLLTEMDNSAFGQYLTEYQGKVVQLDVLHSKIAEAFGKKNVGKIYLGCTRGILVDIYVSLPALIPQDESLKALIDRAPNYKSHDACSARVRISDFNRDSLDAYT